MENVCKINEKLTFVLIWALFKVKKDPQYGPWDPYFTHTWKYSWYSCKVSSSHTKKFHLFWGNIVVHIQVWYCKDWMKTEGAYFIWIQSWRRMMATDDNGWLRRPMDRWQTARYQISSTIYVSSRAKNIVWLIWRAVSHITWAKNNRKKKQTQYFQKDFIDVQHHVWKLRVNMYIWKCKFIINYKTADTIHYNLQIMHTVC